MIVRRGFPLVIIAMAVMAATGCTGSRPTFPSPLSASGSAGASVSGVVTGGDAELRVLVSGLSAACPNLTFTVNGAPVVTHGFTRFEDGFCGALQNGTWVEVKGTRQPDGSVLADKVDIDHAALDVKVKGTVSGLTGACPNLTFGVKGTSVATDSSTWFKDGPCSAVQNGRRVEVKGTSQANGSVLAHTVEIDGTIASISDLSLRGST